MQDVIAARRPFTPAGFFADDDPLIIKLIAVRASPRGAEVDIIAKLLFVPEQLQIAAKRRAFMDEALEADAETIEI